MNKENLEIINKICNILVDIFIDDSVYEKIALTVGRDNIELPTFACFYSFNIYYWWKFYKYIIDKSKNNTIDKKSLAKQTIICIQELQKALSLQYSKNPKRINSGYRKSQKLYDLLYILNGDLLNRRN